MQWQPDWGLRFRMGFTMFLLFVLYIVFLGILTAYFGNLLVPVVLMGGFSLFQYFFSDKLALRSMGAHEVSREQAPELHAMIERLCQLSDLPKPKVAVADTEMPNAFAAGRSQKSATVCVTTGLMERLEPRELEGVLAHELSHVANRDVMVMTVASFLATVAGLLIRMGLYSGLGGSGRRDNTVLIFFVVLIVSILVYVLSFFLLRALSRYREYAADRGAAIMTGAPSQLASALAKITGAMSRIPTRDLRRAEGLNAFFIMPAVAQGFSLSSIFHTHPPAERRIERLLEMQAQMDGRVRAEI